MAAIDFDQIPQIVKARIYCHSWPWSYCPHRAPFTELRPCKGKQRGEATHHGGLLVKLVMLHIFIVILLLCTCVKFGLYVLPKTLKLQPEKIATTSNMCTVQFKDRNPNCVCRIVKDYNCIMLEVCSEKFLQKSLFRKNCSCRKACSCTAHRGLKWASGVW